MRRAFRHLPAVAICVMAWLAPAAAQASTVSVRIETPTATLVPDTPVTLPDAPVAPAGALDGQTCAGTSVVGALSAATGNNWSGTWTDGTGWSIDRIKSVDLTSSLSKKWAVLVSGAYSNDPPCNKLLGGNESLIFFPVCTAQSTTGCFTGGPLIIDGQTQSGLDVAINLQVWQTDFVFINGQGTVQRTAGVNATLTSPSDTSRTDPYYGTGSIRVASKGPATIVATKAGYMTGRHDVCITDGGDGYCGTVIPPTVPFDPYAYCTTTGSDGYCNSPDHVAPVGRIGAPLQAQAFGKKAGPDKLKGTVDFDPSLTDYVNLRLMRQITARVTVRYKTRKVWVTRKIKGKRVRKRVTKRTPVKKKQPVCYYWSDADTEFKRLKKCDASTAPQFRAAGAEIWTYEFLSRLPAGAYTLDALAVDGAGNKDATMEPGRNRVTFKVS